MSIFSFKSNGKKHSSLLSFGDSYLAWLLVTFIKESETNLNINFKDLEISFLYKIIDEEFGSGSVDKAYKSLMKKTTHKTDALIKLIDSRNSQIVNDGRLVNFPK